MSRAAELAEAEAAAWTTGERNAFGMLVFLAAEAMFFAGLISTFVVLRAGAAASAWPPPGQPRLPIGVTGANTGVLLLSAVTLRAALAAVRRGRTRRLIRTLAATAALGGIFLAVQGFEWARLIAHGLRATGGPYASTFCTLIGVHALHVAAALVALLLVLGRARRGRYSTAAHGGIELASLYWTFVVALWPILYVLVYLT